MKKIIMVSMSLLCCAPALAQEEFESLLSESKVWTMTTKPSLNPEEFGDLRYIEETKLVGDTIINGIHFMRKYNRRCKQGDEMPTKWSATNEYLGQEGSRIYQYSSRSKKMILDMDFALGVGDKVSYYFDDEVVLFDFVVTAVSDTIIGNSTDKARRRCMYAQVEDCPSVTDVWIEGIGSMQYGISGVWKTMATGSFDQMIKCTDGNKCIFTANATVDEYTDPKTNVVYTYEPGCGTASVKAGYDELIEVDGCEMESIYHSGCPDATGDVVILDRFAVGTEEYVVTGIGEGAFYENNNIKSVSIPETVTDIGEEAFAYCENLTEVHLPECLTQIAPDLFRDCVRLVSVNIPSSVSTIGLFAFAGCSSLVSLTLPEGLTFVGRSAFNHTPWYDGLYNEAPDGLFYIGSLLFGYKGDKPAGDLVIKEGTTFIGIEAFNGCDGLTSVTIPKSVVSVDEYAFYNCTGLTAVYITDLAAWCGIDFKEGISHISFSPLYYAHHLYLNGKEVTVEMVNEFVGIINRGDLTTTADLNGDGVVNIADIVMLMNHLPGIPGERFYR